MAAPPIVITEGPPPVTVEPIDKNGFRIVINVQDRQNVDDDWRVSITLQRIDVSVIDLEDQSAASNQSHTIPFNEAPDLAALGVKLQTLVDAVFDQIVPSPAP